MKNTAMILGIIGGILGMIVAALAIIAGFAVRFVSQVIPPNVNFPFPVDRLFPYIGMFAAIRGTLALVSAIIALVAAVMVKRKSLTPGIVLLVTGIAGFLFLFIGYLVPGVLLIIGGALALADQDKKPSVQPGITEGPKVEE